MGLLTTKWEAQYEGHDVRVVRTEVTRGFEIRIDGERVGGKSWSLIGVGEAEGRAHMGGRDVPVKVELSLGSECNVWIDGRQVKMQQTG